VAREAQGQSRRVARADCSLTGIPYLAGDLRLHEQRESSVESFSPHPGEGLDVPVWRTVQATPHIGHVGRVLNFDILIRWMKAGGFRGRSAEPSQN